jgi:hypothetical protein
VDETGGEDSSGGDKDDNKRGIGDDAITLPPAALAQERGKIDTAAWRRRQLLKR